jgi:hypothetical protein
LDGGLNEVAEAPRGRSPLEWGLEGLEGAEASDGRSPLEGDLRGLIETSGVPWDGGLCGLAIEVAEAPSGRSSGLLVVGLRGSRSTP